MEIEAVGVAGAGIMGSGVALDLAAHGVHVVLTDIGTKQLDAARDEIKDQLRLAKMTVGTFRKLTVEEVVDRIEFETDYKKFHRVDFVIENVPEDWDTKRAVYGELVRVCGGEVVFAANTSCISITKIGALTPSPKNVVGMHFMNPVPMKKMVEVIRGHHTGEDTLAAAMQLLKRLNKSGIVVNDSPGFVTNRVLMPMINECIFLVQEGIATPQDVDKMFRSGFAHAMGPLATADLIGLDTILGSLNVLYESFNDSKYRPCPLLKKMVDAELLGRKSGEGFFKYNR